MSPMSKLKTRIYSSVKS